MSATENGSASTAMSSATSSGQGMAMDVCAGTSSAKPPVASEELPLWMPGARCPAVKLWHMFTSPAAHAGQSGEMPRGAQDSHGFSTTRSPTRRPLVRPASTISPTSSWPSTCGKLITEVMGESGSPSMNTCLTSDPQMPQRLLLMTTQSSAGSTGSGRSCSAIGVVASARTWEGVSSGSSLPSVSGVTP